MSRPRAVAIGGWLAVFAALLVGPSCTPDTLEPAADAVADVAASDADDTTAKDVAAIDGTSEVTGGCTVALDCPDPKALQGSQV